MQYKLIKDFDVGSICFRAGIEFMYDNYHSGFHFLSYYDAIGQYSGRLRVEENDFQTFFREV